MTFRYILIDRPSGFVWGEATAETPAEACRIVDRGCIIAEPCEYETHAFRANPPTNSGYLVYEAPADFPQVTDGQDKALIAAVEQSCRPVAMVTSIDAEQAQRNRENEAAYAAYMREA